jgi:TIR domain
MSFVGRPYTHDVFVSYAHGEDLEEAYSDPGRNPLYKWSCTLIDNLSEQIALNLSHSGRKPDVWMDRALRSTGSLEGNLTKEIRSSALFVALISPYYLRSRWCQDEARAFSDFARDFRSVERQDRIFVVSMVPTDREVWPPALRDDGQKAFLGMDFYRKRGEDRDLWPTLGWPDPSVARDQNDYWAQVKQLANEITSQLIRMRYAQENSAGAGNAVEVPVFVGRKLLLGYCFDTLVRQRDQLRSMLSSMEMQILPGESDITDPKSVESSYDHYLEQADAVVLVANEYCGLWPKDEEAGFISLQVRMARERTKRCYICLNIQNPDQIQTDSYREYLNKLPEEIAKTGGALFTGQDIKGFASFIKSELAALNPRDIPRPALICSNLSLRQNEYKQFYDWVLDALGELNYEVIRASDSGSGQIRLDGLEGQVDQSDAILVLCFDQEWGWAKEISRELNSVSSSANANRARLIVVGPNFDPAKGVREYRNYHFKTFNDFNESRLDATSFKETLKRAIQQNAANITQLRPT